jgi:hypothetical protein
MTCKLVVGIVTFLVRKASVVIATTPHKGHEWWSRGLDLSTTAGAGRDILPTVAVPVRRQHGVFPRPQGCPDDGVARQPKAAAAGARPRSKMPDRGLRKHMPWSCLSRESILFIKELAQALHCISGAFTPRPGLPASIACPAERRLARFGPRPANGMCCEDNREGGGAWPCCSLAAMSGVNGPTNRKSVATPHRVAKSTVRPADGSAATLPLY